MPARVVSGGNRTQVSGGLTRIDMSVNSYVRLRCPLEEAMVRYGRWVGTPEVRLEQADQPLDF